MLNILDRQSMLLDMLNIAARFFVPDDLLSHGLFLRLRPPSLWYNIAIRQ
jgi:hypothetical protein